MNKSIFRIIGIIILILFSSVASQSNAANIDDIKRAIDNKDDIEIYLGLYMLTEDEFNSASYRPGKSMKLSQPFFIAPFRFENGKRVSVAEWYPQWTYGSLDTERLVEIKNPKFSKSVSNRKNCTSFLIKNAGEIEFVVSNDFSSASCKLRIKGVKDLFFYVRRYNFVYKNINYKSSTYDNKGAFLSKNDMENMYSLLNYMCGDGKGMSALTDNGTGKYKNEYNSKSLNSDYESTKTTPTAHIDRVWIDYFAVENGVHGMRIHLDFTVSNALGHEINANLYFQVSGGAPLKDFDGLYTTNDGEVACWQPGLKPLYEHSRWTDLTLFMPLSQFHMQPGNYVLQFVPKIYDVNTKSFIGEYEAIGFNYSQK